MIMLAVRGSGHGGLSNVLPHPSGAEGEYLVMHKTPEQKLPPKRHIKGQKKLQPSKAGMVAAACRPVPYYLPAALL